MKFYPVNLFTDSTVNYYCVMNCIDHIVIAAATLAQGVDYLQTELGIKIPAGGRHRTLGTHNHLMQLGNDAYLELISIDPASGAPDRPRWFELDRGLLRDAIAQQPRLITWVMNTADIHRLQQQTGFDIGIPNRLTRDQLEWEIALPDDGRLLAGGLLPYCIQWHSAPHPSRSMADLGCRLEALTLHHNRTDWLGARMQQLEARHLATIEPLLDSAAPYLSASIRVPSGEIITLSS